MCPTPSFQGVAKHKYACTLMPVDAANEDNAMEAEQPTDELERWVRVCDIFAKHFILFFQFKLILFFTSVPSLTKSPCLHFVIRLSTLWCDEALSTVPHRDKVFKDQPLWSPTLPGSFWRRSGCRAALNTQRMLLVHEPQFIAYFLNP